MMLFPTFVGVFLKTDDICNLDVIIPHERGGVSVVSNALATVFEVSPRTWGCFNNNNYGGNVNDY